VSLFARRLPFLERLFPSSGREVAVPNEVTDAVHLVHPWPGRALGFLTVDQIQISSSSVVTPTLVALSAAADEWIEVIAGDISHDSATARIVQATLFHDVLLRQTFIALWSLLDTAFSTLGGFAPLFGHSAGTFAAGKVVKSPPWPLIIPPSTSLRFVGDTAGAAYALTFSGFVIRHPIHAEPVAI
jgi:hypothetical protein